MKLYRKGAATIRVITRRIVNPLRPILSEYERNREIIFFCLFCFGVGTVEVSCTEWNYLGNKVLLFFEWLLLSSMCGAISVIGTLCGIFLIAKCIQKLLVATRLLQNLFGNKLKSLREEIRQEEIIIAEKEEKRLAPKAGTLAFPSESSGTLTLAGETNGTLSLAQNRE